MANKLAIDVVLLLPSEIMDLAIKLNRANEQEFQLNKTNRLPHITLSQAVIKSSELELAKSRLDKIASTFSPLRLKTTDKPGMHIEIENSKELYSLHLTVMKKFVDLVTYDAEEQYFNDEFVREGSLEWVRNFRTDAAFDKYWPHITLGVSEKLKDIPSTSFTAKRLAICHLGNFNTCTKILYEVALRER